MFKQCSECKFQKNEEDFIRYLVNKEVRILLTCADCRNKKNSYLKQWSLNNKDKILKYNSKSRTTYRKEYNKKTKEHRKEWFKGYKAQNIQKIKEKAKKYNILNKEILSQKRKMRYSTDYTIFRNFIKLQKSKPCLDCKQSFPYYIMQYDHRPNEIKVFEISRAFALHKSEEEILSEIKKCDLVCPNCHAIRTWTRSHKE